jgi:hypothetical protein
LPPTIARSSSSVPVAIEHGRALARLGTDEVQQPGAALRIRAHGRLVQQQHAWPVHDAAGEVQPPLHSATEAPHRLAAAAGQTDHLQRFLDALPHLRAAQAEDAGPGLEVLPRRQVLIQRRLLRHQTQLPPRPDAVAPHVVTADAQPARRGQHQPAQAMDRRRLAGAIRAE